MSASLEFSGDRLESLTELAQRIRRDIVAMIASAGTGHLGPSLSCVEILISLYFDRMNHKPEDPTWSERDRLILCKGHAAPALYATLAHAGYFDPETLPSLRKSGSLLQGHPTRATPGVDASTGSLGQGLSIANGMALAARLDGRSYRVFALTGDGECDEGQIWEAAMTASHLGLSNVTAIIDRNGVQSDDATERIKKKEPLDRKWRSFGWQVLEIDGHNFMQIHHSFDVAEWTTDRPTVVIARTVKGKGLSFLEGDANSHNASFSEEDLDWAMEELRYS
ncbi:transketolase [[Eubacterium] cellulosolvens]